MHIKLLEKCLTKIKNSPKSFNKK